METNFVLADETIQTPRLVLRAFRQLDLDDLYAYASVAGVGEMAGGNITNHYWKVKKC